MVIIETCPECGHDLHYLVLDTYPPITQKKCINCGWECAGKQEEVIRIPFGKRSELIIDDLGDICKDTNIAPSVLNNVDFDDCAVPTQQGDKSYTCAEEAIIAYTISFNADGELCIKNN